jgi:hypothetical protein
MTDWASRVVHGGSREAIDYWNGTGAPVSHIAAGVLDLLLADHYEHRQGPVRMTRRR